MPPVFLGKRVAVVVPARDEARFIEETILGVPEFVEHVIVVDDGSVDGTGELAARGGGARVTVIRHAAARGVGAAIASGYRLASALGCDVVAVMAGDGQMHPDDLADVVAPVASGAVDYVKGNRLRHRDVLRRMPFGRLCGTAVFGWLTSMATGIAPLGDSQCGYTAIAARALAALDLDRLWPGYGYPNDLLGALAISGHRVGEVAVRPVYRGEASGLKLRHLAVIVFLIARIVLRRGAVSALSLAAPARWLSPPAATPSTPSRLR
jgi:glycosyltransferase involved in cell wall biosynthesis